MWGMIDMIPFFMTMGIVLGVLLVSALLYLLVFIRPRGRQPSDPALLCDYAHRGLHNETIPENSLSAFKRACEQGCGIELDVQLSRDGVVMVFHDYALARMTGAEGKLRERDASELQKLKLSGSDQTIPTFAEVLELVGGRVPLLVELKGENLDTSLCEKVADHLRTYPGPYCIESFNPLLLRRMKQFLPETYYGLLYTNTCRDKKSHSLLNLLVTAMMLNFLARPHFIAYNQLDRDSLPVKLTTRLYRAPRFVWTVRSDETFNLAHKLGEHPIFENLTEKQ